MYKQTTSQITISVVPIYLEKESSPKDQKYFWSYHVEIQNNGLETVKLSQRHWQIINSEGVRQEISGDGVIGEQPVLEAGESFSYTSAAPLDTPSGMMLGHYTMSKQNGVRFSVNIPAFSLDSPHGKLSIH